MRLRYEILLHNRPSSNGGGVRTELVTDELGEEEGSVEWRKGVFVMYTNPVDLVEGDE